jgi:hypothetical protein
MDMAAPARWAGVLAMAGGALLTVILIIVAFSPTSNTWYGLFLGIVLLGAAVPGLYWRTRPATGRFGLGAAWLSGLGAAAIVLVAAYLVGTSQVSPAQQSLPEGPATAIGMGASVVWLIGNLGFALALLRSRVLPALGAWLVLAGAFVPLALTPVVGDSSAAAATQALTLIFGLLPVGWTLLGYTAWRRLGA